MLRCFFRFASSFIAIIIIMFIINRIPRTAERYFTPIKGWIIYYLLFIIIKDYFYFQIICTHAHDPFADRIDR